jgi:hypothetical protein
MSILIVLRCFGRFVLSNLNSCSQFRQYKTFLRCEGFSDFCNMRLSFVYDIDNLGMIWLSTCSGKGKLNERNVVIILNGENAAR